MLFLTISLTSCYSTQKLIDKSTNTPTKFSKEKINGIYKNRIEGYTRTGLWNILADNKSFQLDTTAVQENSFVAIKLVDDTTIRATLIENDTPSKQMEFKGNIVGNYFSIKKKLLLIPIPAIFLYKERKTIIGTNSNGNLIITRANKNGAWFLVMAADSGDISSCEIEKKNL